MRNNYINSLQNNNEIDDLKKELYEAMKIIEYLNIRIKDLENQLKNMKKIIDEKDEELNKLETKLKQNYISINKKQNNPINNKDFDNVLNFISNDQKLRFAIPCSGNSIFAEIEEKLYKEFPEYRETNNFFLINGKEILRFKSINDNKLEKGKPIILYQPS